MMSRCSVTRVYDELGLLPYPSTTTENPHHRQHSRSISSQGCVYSSASTGAKSNSMTPSVKFSALTTIATRRTGPSAPSSLSQPSPQISSISSINRPTSAISDLAERRQGYLLAWVGPDHLSAAELPPTGRKPSCGTSSPSYACVCCWAPLKDPVGVAMEVNLWFSRWESVGYLLDWGGNAQYLALSSCSAMNHEYVTPTTFTVTSVGFQLEGSSEFEYSLAHWQFPLNLWHRTSSSTSNSSLFNTCSKDSYISTFHVLARKVALPVVRPIVSLNQVPVVCLKYIPNWSNRRHRPGEVI